MAKLPENKPSALSNLGEPPPKGTYLAVCVDVVDEYNVTRRKFESDEMETVNLTRFIFGVKCKDGSLRKIASKPMKISNYETSALYAFLLGWLGAPQKAGFDTAALKDKGAQITVVENDKGYMNLGTCTEVMEELLAKVPRAEDFRASADNDNTGAEIPF
jgi:hypothetical protein